jgi:hypothetical protein
MWQGIVWLFEDPFSFWVFVAIVVSAIQHHREMTFIDRKAADLEDRMRRLELLLATAPVPA